MSDVVPPTAGRMEFRVRYVECDPMGMAHHTAYPVWFEMGRTELLRESGMNYRDLEAQGILLAVARLNVRYKRPARYDDVLTLHTRVVGNSRVKIEHEYQLFRGDELLAEASSTLACLDAAGALRALPDSLVALLGVE
ncbi:MAG TPA: thioesterase family protein [Phycisphaerales bacterium]|nr:thioesterase family protein [Phycisphaerales bacterium]HRQ76833.1 thioesterase family protein [Phycisphaerales bacterium]